MIFILIFSSHRRLDLSSVLFPSGPPPERCAPHLSPIRAIYPVHLIHLILLMLRNTDHKANFYVLFFTPHVTSSLLGPNIFSSTLFSNTLPSMTDQVSHPCKITGKIIVLCMLIFIFLDSEQKYKRFCTE